MEADSLISAPCPEEALEALVERYERPGPRYTSYPTAVQFSEDFTRDDYDRCLQTAASRKGEPLTIYLHVPFCEHRCLYCGCNVVPTLKRSVAEDYLEHLTREIRILSDFFKGERPTKVLHIGGGTPTYLTAAWATTEGTPRMRRNPSCRSKSDPLRTPLVRGQPESLRPGTGN